MTGGWVQVIATGGAPVILAFLFIAMTGAREVPLWVFGREYRKDQARQTSEIARLEAERVRERERADKYEAYTLRLLETARQATAVATDAVSKRGGT